MRKIYLSLLGLTILLPIHASAVTCGSKPLCKDYGYIHNGCPGNFVACPFDANFKTCDEEAYKDDFKFALASGNAVNRDDWEKANTSGSVYDKAFIVGRGGTSDKGVNGKTYCMPKAVLPTGQTSLFPAAPGTPAQESVSKHQHSSSYTVTSSTVGIVGIKQALMEDGWNIPSQCNVTTASISSENIGFETVPSHYVVDGYFYAYTPGKRNEEQAALPTSKPNCDNLGYKDSVSDCPGDYVVCPFDDAKVMCDMEAKAGEIKFSLQTADHDGWLLCDGRTLSGIKVNGVSAANSELATILSSDGKWNWFNGKLPSYNKEDFYGDGSKGTFLRLGTPYNSAGLSSVGDHNHTISCSSCSSFNSTTTGFTSVQQPGDKGFWGKICKDKKLILTTTTKRITKASTSCISGDNECSIGDEVAPFHYYANIFIYTGKL